MDASLARLELARAAGVSSLALEAAEGIAPRDALERSWRTELAAAHAMAMRLAAKADQQLGQVVDWQIQARQQVRAIEAARLAGAAARMMDAFQKGALALDRLRHGGRQVVTVRRVQVNEGGQAIVAGEVRPAAREGGGDGR